METIRTSELRFAEYNPRKQSTKEKNSLKRSIREFGFIEPIVINSHPGRENIIIGGNQRVMVASELGMEEVPYITVNLPEAKEKILNIALNRIRDEFDEDKLSDLITELDKTDVDMILSGLTDREIDKLIKEITTGKEDIIPTIDEKKITTKLGDIWQCGKHKIMCGDCTKEDDIKKLVGDDVIDLVLTDPPYNIGYDYHSPKANDNKKPEEYEKWCKSWYKIMKKYSDKILITSGIWNIVTWFNIEKHKWILCWYRRNSQSRSILKGFTRWEPIILYNKHEQIIFYGNNDKVIPSDVYLDNYTQIDDVYDINTAFYEDSGTDGIASKHPCPKPVKLWAKLIKDFTRTRNIVLDIFLGAGTALIAAERMSRICYGMEIDPFYVEIAIKRWENYTGQKAIKLDKSRQEGN